MGAIIKLKNEELKAALPSYPARLPQQAQCNSSIKLQVQGNLDELSASK